MKRFIKTYGIELLIIVLLALVPLLWLSKGQIILGHDANYHINHFSRMISSMFSWNDLSYYGRDWTYDRGYTPINIIQGIFLVLTPSFSSMQTVFFICLFCVLGMGVWIPLVMIFPDKRYVFFRLLSSCFAMFNFFILQGWFTADTGRFLVFAGLPLYFLIIHKWFTGSWTYKKTILLFALISFFFNGNGLPPLVGFQWIMIGLLSIFYGFYRIRKTGWMKGIIFTIASFLIGLLIFFVINLYWLLPIMNFTSVSYGSDFATFGGPEGTIAWEHMISKYASLTHLFQLQGLADWYDNPNHGYSHPFISQPFLILVSFVPIATILFGLWKQYHRGLTKDKRYFLYVLYGLFIFGLFMASGTHAPFGKIYESFMRYIPGFVIFRSSLYKFGFAVWVPAIILFGFFTNEILLRFPLKRSMQTFCVGMILVLLVLFHYPYFFPEKVFHFTPPFTTRFILPAYVTEMLGYIDTHLNRSDRILLLPELDREYIGLPVDAYTWGFYSLIMLPNYISNHSYIADRESDIHLEMLYDSIYSHDFVLFEKLIERLGITHILFRNDVALSPGGIKAHSIPSVLKSLTDVPFVTLEKQIGEWGLYKINVQKPTHTIDTIGSFDIVTGSRNTNSYLLGRKDVLSDHAIVRIFDSRMEEKLMPEAQNIITEAECLFCKKDEFQAFVDSITPPQYPNSFKRTITLAWSAVKRYKDKKRSPQETIDIHLSATQMDIARGLKYGFTEESATVYQSHWNSIDALYKTLTGRDRVMYANRLFAFLESQESVLSKQKNMSESWKIVYKDAYKKDSWYSVDTQALRYGMSIDTEGMYILYIPNENLYDASILIDGISHRKQEKVFFSKGYHTIEINKIGDVSSVSILPPALFALRPLGRTSFQHPKISFKKIYPTKYQAVVRNATSAVILRFNQKFDSRWSARIVPADTSMKTLLVPNAHHVEVDSYANGWFVDKTGNYDIILEYLPQRQFTLGMIGSMVALVGFLIYASIRK
jgi:hypothetical protein